MFVLSCFWFSNKKKVQIFHWIHETTHKFYIEMARECCSEKIKINKATLWSYLQLLFFIMFNGKCIQDFYTNKCKLFAISNNTEETFLACYQAIKRLHPVSDRVTMKLKTLIIYCPKASQIPNTTPSNNNEIFLTRS
jgi:hypothetical protein